MFSRKPSATLAALLIPAAVLAAAPALAAPAKNVVLVHGALADGSGWRQVYDILTKDGYRVTAVQQPMTSLEDDVAATKRVLAMQDGPTVLVGHSYGGQIISEAGDDPHVKSLVYIAALQPDVGDSVGKLAGSMPAPSDDIKKTPDGLFLYLDPANFIKDFCADVPAEQAAFMRASQMPVSVASFTTPAKVSAWHVKPSFAIVATKDGILSTDLQRSMAKHAGSTVTEIASSHVPFISHPDEVAKVIETAAKAGE